MDSIQIFNKCIIWTRSISLILSIIIMILSLSIYNYNALPILELLHQQDNTTIKASELFYDMIQDRRFIATLVAAQASIFCPLFLLMTSTSPLPTKSIKFSYTETYRIVIEQFCYFLMPFGLALSWIFCIIFDKKTESALLELEPFGYLDNNMTINLSIYIVDNLKYIIISIFVLEIVFIWMSSFEYARVLSNSQPILLDEEEGKQQVLCI